MILRWAKVSALAVAWMLLTAGTAGAQFPPHYLMVGQYGIGSRGMRGIDKQAVDYRQLPPYPGPYGDSVRSVYVWNEQSKKAVEIGWVWQGVGMPFHGQPVTFIAYDIGTGPKQYVDVGPRPGINGSPDYRLLQTTASSGDWRFQMDGATIASLDDSNFIAGRATVSSERFDSRDSPYGRYWGLQYMDSAGTWKYWDRPVQVTSGGTAPLWRTMSSKHDIEIYRP